MKEYQKRWHFQDSYGSKLSSPFQKMGKQFMMNSRSLEPCHHYFGIQIEWCGFGGPGLTPRVLLNLLYLQVEKRKKISTRCPEKSRFKKDFFWWPVCTSAFLGQNQRLSGFWVLLSTVHSSAVQCSARQAGQVRADCYARSAEKKRSSQFDELNTQLYVL